ncbi:MAG: nucleoside recognition domain-containing protein [Eubacteriales bacterium]
MTDYLVPLLMVTVSVVALAKKQDVYGALLEGGKDGLQTMMSIVPALVMLLTAVHMLRASGAIDVLSNFLAPTFALFGIPPEVAPLMLLRPISGSAALAVAGDLMVTYGVDSQIGRTAAIMLGSTETTFYTIAVYFGANGIKNTRYAIPAALIADFTGFLVASWTTNLFFPT